MRRELESNLNSLHAFAVRSKEERARPADPKRPRPEPDEKWSNKWAPCRWCKGPHWHKDCTKRKSKRDKSDTKHNSHNSDSRAALATAEPEPEPRSEADAALSALFAQVAARSHSPLMPKAEPCAFALLTRSR
eukprot:3050793-Pleurochrysis_carterae.AAC.1